MSQSVHQIVVEGKDKTKAAFGSIAANASRLGGLVAGALGGLGAYLSFRAINDGIQSLGHLSDIAMKTGTSASELTAFSNALNMLGIQRVDIDSLGRAFDYMQKTTGRTGLKGMLQTIEELSKIPDTAKRGTEAMRIFGRTGMEFMPLIAGAAKNGIGALEGVVAAMPRIADEASNTGDAVADAEDILAKGFQSAWLGVIGVICGALDSQFTGGVREAAAMAANWLEYYAKVGVAKAMQYYNQFADYSAALGTFFGALAGGEGISAAFEAFQNESRMAYQLHEEEDKAMDERVAKWREAADERAKIINSLQENSDMAAISGSGPGDVAEKQGKAAKDKGLKSAALRNALVNAGSNEARKMALLGPQLGSEQKKTNDLLAGIKKNQEKAQQEADDADAAANSDYETLEAR